VKICVNLWLAPYLLLIPDILAASAKLNSVIGRLAR
jgi:hypothetical protein